MTRQIPKELKGVSTLATEWNKIPKLLRELSETPAPETTGNKEAYVKLLGNLHQGLETTGYKVEYDPISKEWKTLDIEVKVHGGVMHGFAFVDDKILTNLETAGYHIAKGSYYVYLEGMTKEEMVNGSEIDFLPSGKSSTIKVTSPYHSGTLPKDTFVGCFWRQQDFSWVAAIQRCE